MIVFRSLSLFFAVIALTACGGGGGGGSSGSNNIVSSQRSSISTSSISSSSSSVIESSSSSTSISSTSSSTSSSSISSSSSSSTSSSISSASTFTLSGTIQIPVNTLVDDDVNDPNAPYITHIQPAPNPVTLGGYVTAEPTGIAGDTFATEADVIDAYRVKLYAGQSIILNIGDHHGFQNIDLDLALFRANTAEIVQTSLGTTDVEWVTVEETGEYDVAVYAYEGGSNYILTVGNAYAPNSVPPLRLEDDFVPGEVLAVMEEKPAAKSAGNFTALTSAGAVVKAGDAAQLMRLDVKGMAHYSSMNTSSKRHHASGLRDQVAALGAAMLEKYDTIRVLKHLRSREDIQQADLNYLRKTQAIPNDKFFNLQWHYSLINLPQAWNITTGTPANGSIIVAVADTGVHMEHPDLKPNLLTSGYDFVSDPFRSNDGDGIDSDPHDPGDELTPGGSSFHGTHVAGTIAAASNNSIGVAGVSWGAKIMPIRVLGIGGGTDYDILQGIRYAARLPNDSGTLPPQKADIINLSLGGPGFSQLAQNVYNQVRATGTIIIAAAGNDNSSSYSYPASYDGVISVGAVDINKKRAPYSNFNSKVDIAAPGGNTANDFNGDGFPDGVLSTLANDSGAMDYYFHQGTSMATPHVAGVVALMKAVQPNLTPAQLDALIASGGITEDTGNDGDGVRNDHFGYGMIDALKAVQAAASLTSATLPVVIKPSPSLLDFGATTSTLYLKIENAGGGAPVITNLTRNSDATWLNGVRVDVDANGFGTYAISVDRKDLVSASYRATIYIRANPSEVTEVPVRMVVGEAPTNTNSDAGVHYVLLLDPVTNETKYASMVSAVRGSYRYQLDGVAPGNYYLLAGTDLDNDFIVCDPGEACGMYPTRGAPGVINVVDRNLTNIDFTTGFYSNLNAAQSGSQQDKPLVYRRTHTKGSLSK